MQRSLLVGLVCSLLFGVHGRADEKPLESSRPIEQLQPAPLPLDKAAGKMSLPEGFSATLYAGEPDVRQPIGFCLDDRGRLWVAEAYAYPKWQETGRDRIVIFEDSNGDGRADKRTVFWDQANYASGVQVGFGGVWVCSAPHLLFIPDADGDDKPDGPPRVVLDGWSTKGVHNVLNSLEWGPDGWLYGLNGITAPSKVGKPGAPEDQRLDINCGVWRYHPLREVFEVVAHGTTNPFGLDFDDYGQPFITNCVIAHLWHVIPGAHYQRMFGEDYNPHAYQLLPSCADHLHWGGGEWTTSRGGQGVHSEAGGGHAHAGAMIYLGGSWPQEYRGSMFMGNIHGKRINRDRLERHGSGYVARHNPDFLLANDEWFRCINLKYGPDGDVFLIDWSDTGECHETDAHGAHHESGRIYKVRHQGQSAESDPPPGKEAADQPPTPPAGELASLDSLDLAELQRHDNDWYVRHARRLLQERAAAGQDLLAAHVRLTDLFQNHPDETRKLRALWALYASGGTSKDFLRQQLTHANEYVRAWAIQLLVDDQPPSEAAIERFAALAKEDESPLVRLHLASALQRLPLEDRWAVVEGLISHGEDADDANLPLMIWYGVEPLVPADKARAVGLIAKCKIPLVRQHITRRAVAAK